MIIFSPLRRTTTSRAAPGPFFNALSRAAPVYTRHTDETYIYNIYTVYYRARVTKFLNRLFFTIYQTRFSILFFNFEALQKIQEFKEYDPSKF